MTDHLQNMYLSCNTLYVIFILDLIFLQDFYGDLFSREIMDSKFYFSKCSLADRLAQHVLADVVRGLGIRGFRLLLS